MKKKNINQEILIKKSIGLIKNQSNESLVYSPFNCINSWSPNHLGNIRLKAYLGLTSKIKYIYSIIKAILILGFVDKYFLFNKNKFKLKSKAVLFSWCKLDDFNKDGSFNDRYFRVNSKKTRMLTFFLISIDNKLPKTLDKNILIFSQISSRRNFNILRPIVFFIRHVMTFKSFYKKFYMFWNIDTIFSKELISIMRENRFLYQNDKYFLPYEAQNWQHAIYQEIKNEKQTAEVIGYLHSLPNALPTEYLYRYGAPDKIVVHGAGIKSLLINYLKWPKKRIDIQKSTRYLVSDKLEFNRKIFLPHSFSNHKIYLIKLEKFFKSCRKNSIPLLIVRNHPAPSSPKKSLQFENEINELIKKYMNIFDINSNVKLTVMIGATAAVVEGLERGCNIIHISNDEVFEVMEQNLWEGIKIKKIGEGIYEYKLFKKSYYIKLGIKNSLLKEYIKK